MREFLKLTPSEQVRFLAAVAEFVSDLRMRRFRPGLRIKTVRGHPGVMELSWAPDGRATFHYGTPAIPGETHVVWRRVGGHDIFQDP